MSDILLYVAPGSCARVPTIALEETGAPFDTHLIRFMKGEHRSPDYLRVNPLGKVPAMNFRGEILTENVAMLTHLADAFPEARLLPETDRLGRTRQIADLCFVSATLHPIVTRIRMPHFFVDAPEAQANLHAKAVEAMKMQYAVVENRLANGPWWYGDQWSVMDGYLFWTWFRVTGAGFPADAFPRFADHARRISERPSVARALAREAEQVAILESEGLMVPPPR